jgi:single-stranded DNA-binding protein
MTQRTVYNHIEVEGNLGAEPRIQYFESSAFVVEFNIAIYQGKDKDGNVKPPCWKTVKAWGFEAATELHKGDKVHIVGQFGVDNWKDKATGEPRSKDYIFVNSKFDKHSVEFVPRTEPADEF